MNLAFSEPWALLLGIFAAVPLISTGQKIQAYSSLALVPEDPLSTAIDRALRVCAVSAILCLAAGIAGPHLREQWVERIGTGAHIVLLIDRSSSMNENFSGRYLGGATHESKSAIASKLLAEFAGRRREDLFALVAFSAAPVYVLPLTQDQEAVQAAIRSLGNRGHGVTNIAPGLAMALDYFSGRPLTGSRIILLVSDGAARIDAETGDYLRQVFQNNRAALYWIYLRNPKGGTLSTPPQNPNESTTPEYFLHRYFQTLGVPYRAYEADNPEAVQRAIVDVEQLENQPLHYLEKLPRLDLSGWCYGASLIFMLTLLVFRALEVKSWR